MKITLKVEDESGDVAIELVATGIQRDSIVNQPGGTVSPSLVTAKLLEALAS
jgi:hypothetical protein